MPSWSTKVSITAQYIVSSDIMDYEGSGIHLQIQDGTTPNHLSKIEAIFYFITSLVMWTM